MIDFDDIMSALADAYGRIDSITASALTGPRLLATIGEKAGELQQFKAPITCLLFEDSALISFLADLS